MPVGESVIIAAKYSKSVLTSLYTHDYTCVGPPSEYYADEASLLCSAASRIGEQVMPFFLAHS